MSRYFFHSVLVILAVSMALVRPLTARGEDGGSSVPPENWAVHGQSTFVEQYHPAFHSPYQGTNSLLPGNESKETFDATLYAGRRLWTGAEGWINLEIDQGFGLTTSLGAAGFTSGEAYKVGQWTPYWRLPRAFIRQTIDLGGDAEKVDADLNQLAGQHTANRIVLTLGKFSVTDIFDNNQYAHDPRNDFLNWSIIDIGSFDYASDAWGYSEGVAAEWYQGLWVARAGLSNMSRDPNGRVQDNTFHEVQSIAELEEQHMQAGKPGKLRALIFMTDARMAAYDEATDLAIASGTIPTLSPIRQFHTKVGGGLNFEQQLSDDLGAFARAGLTQGKYEAYDFTDINKTLSFGLSLNGASWSRGKDTVGLGFAADEASPAAKRFFAAGGLGILVGDGQLNDPSAEEIMETNYRYTFNDHASLSADYQFLNNPGYNTQRGPVSVFGVRGHIQF